MTIVLGVDGGGTKTHVAVADTEGALLGIASSGASNWEDVGVGAAGATVQAAVREALAAAGVAAADIGGAVFGLAGIDWPADEVRMGSIAETLGLGGRWEMVNDAFVALRAGANHPWGVVVVAGSGTVVAGRDQSGETFRTLGLGPLFGDFGSATDIAEDAMRAVAEDFTGMGPHTSLGRLFCTQAEAASTGELLERFSRHPEQLDRIDLFAPLVFEAADVGDVVARTIAERAGGSLGATAGQVTRRLGMDELPVEVVLAGGVFRSGNRALIAAFEREVHRTAPKAISSRLEVPPVVGAALRAMELTGATELGEVHLRLSLEVIRSLGYEQR
jgi:N-acetylglucosamine kinase-like BadF-type ATPase